MEGTDLSLSLSLSLARSALVRVECLFFRTPGPAPPLSGANQRARKGRPTGTPPP